VLLSEAILKAGVEGHLTADSEIGSLGDANYNTPKLLAFAENAKYMRMALRNPNLACVVTSPACSQKFSPRCVLVTDAPRTVFFLIHNYLATRTDFYGAPFPNAISPEAIIHPTAYIAPQSVRIGRGTVLEPNVVVNERTEIGENVTIRAGVVLGSEGFQFVRTPGGIMSVVHAGGVRLHNRVEIQANCAVSRGLFGNCTVIGEDVKIDNLVHVAHGVRIGSGCLIAAGATIAGTVDIGNDAWIGPGVCISDHLSIGSRARITIGAVVVENVADGERVTGNFAVSHSAFMNHFAAMRREQKK